jgi:hypothetical protein
MHDPELFINFSLKHGPISSTVGHVEVIEREFGDEFGQ